MKTKKLIALGDSNTQYGFDQSGWLSLVSNMLVGKCDVLNRGISGYNTDHIRQLMPKIFGEFDDPADEICCVLVMLGSNDSTSAENTIQHVPLERFKSNLAHILDYLLDTVGLSRDRIVLVTPARIDEHVWREALKQYSSDPCTHSDASVRLYAAACLPIGAERQITCVDLNAAMRRAGESRAAYSQYFYDGLHLSSLGGKLLFELLEPLLNERVANKLEFNFPYWRDVKLTLAP